MGHIGRLETTVAREGGIFAWAKAWLAIWLYLKNDIIKKGRGEKKKSLLKTRKRLERAFVASTFSSPFRVRLFEFPAVFLSRVLFCPKEKKLQNRNAAK